MWKHQRRAKIEHASLMSIGPQSHQEAHLQESWSLPQRIQADVQAWNPHEQDGSQGRQLLRPSWAQTGFCHQDQRVRFFYLPCCRYMSPVVVNDVALFSPSYRPWWFLLKISQILWNHHQVLIIMKLSFESLLMEYLVCPQYQWCQPQSPQGSSASRLRQIFNGVFVKLNKASINMLRIAEPYIAWGYVNTFWVENV